MFFRAMSSTLPQGMQQLWEAGMAMLQFSCGTHLTKKVTKGSRRRFKGALEMPIT